MQNVESALGPNGNNENVGTFEAFGKPHGLFSQIIARCSGPGGFYNIGNVIALLTGVAVQIASGSSDQSLIDLIRSYLFGSPTASSLTLSMIIFLAAGEAYHRSNHALAADALRLNRIGDLLAGLAAIVVTFALVSLGDAQLAFVAGTMLALGKFGTVIIPEGAGRPAMSKSFRLLVVASRFPSLFALAMPITGFVDGLVANNDAMLAAIMFACYLLWLWADCLLLLKARA